MIREPTGRGTVEEQLAEIRDYLKAQSRQKQTDPDLVYGVLEEIYRAITEDRPGHNNAGVKVLWSKLIGASVRASSSSPSLPNANGVAF